MAAMGQDLPLRAAGGNVRSPQHRTFAAGRGNDRVSPLTVMPSCSPVAQGGQFICRFTFSMKRSQYARRKPSLATGPESVNWMYARFAGSNFGHMGNPRPLGSPVLAKFVQYCCIASETCRSTTFARIGEPGRNI